MVEADRDIDLGSCVEEKAAAAAKAAVAAAKAAVAVAKAVVSVAAEFVQRLGNDGTLYIHQGRCVS